MKGSAGSKDPQTHLIDLGPV
ncbi:MAG: hypothetical protein RLZZ522_1039, partial [Verrucomicrobiota bacterium]